MSTPLSVPSERGIEQAPMSEERLAEIEARADAATEGPWFIVLGSGNNLCTGIAAEPDVSQPSVHVADCLPEYALKNGSAPADHRPNMAFIAHARTDIPALLAEVRRLRTALSSSRADGERDAQVTRFEVIDHRPGFDGRSYVAYRCHVERSYQDDGRTLKVFVTDAARSRTPETE